MRLVSFLIWSIWCTIQYIMHLHERIELQRRRSRGVARLTISRDSRAPRPRRRAAGRRRRTRRRTRWQRTRPSEQHRSSSSARPTASARGTWDWASWERPRGPPSRSRSPPRAAGSTWAGRRTRPPELMARQATQHIMIIEFYYHRVVR